MALAALGQINHVTRARLPGIGRTEGAGTAGPRHQGGMFAGFIMLVVFAHVAIALDPKPNLAYAIFSARSSFSMQNGTRTLNVPACLCQWPSKPTPAPGC